MHSRECNQLGLAGLSAVGYGVWQKDMSIISVRVWVLALDLFQDFWQKLVGTVDLQDS